MLIDKILYHTTLTTLTPLHVQDAVSAIVGHLLYDDAKTATKYLDPKLVVRGTCRTKKHIEGQSTLVITIGRPNYLARKFIKDCKKAREPFPVQKVQLKFPRPKKTLREMARKNKKK